MSDLLKSLLPALLENRTLNENGIKRLQQLHNDIKKKDKSDRTADEWFVMGYFSIQLGQYDDAITNFSESIFENESFEAAFKFRATAYIEKQQFDEAKKDIDEALKLDPNYIDAQFEQVRLFYEMDDHKTAIQAGIKFTETNPDMASGHALMGSILEKSGKYKESIPAFDKAISIDKENGQFYTQRGLAHYFAANLNEAFNDLEKAQKISGSNQITHFNLALVLAEMDDRVKDAFRNFDRAFSKDPNMLKQFAASTGKTEKDRLLGRIKAILEKIKKSETESGRFYREQLSMMLERKLAETS